MTGLQKVLLETYRQAWVRRQDAIDEVGKALYQLNQSRLVADTAQRWLEKVSAEFKLSGYEKADDYIDRVWPVDKPEEQEWNPHSPVAE